LNRYLNQLFYAVDSAQKKGEKVVGRMGVKENEEREKKGEMGEWINQRR
jgi:hypothetical protein